MPQGLGGPLEEAVAEEEEPITELSAADDDTPADEDEAVSVELEASEEDACAAELLSSVADDEDTPADDEEAPTEDGALDVPLAGALVPALEEDWPLDEESEPPDEEPPDDDDDDDDEEDDEDEEELEPPPVHATRESPAHNDASRHALPGVKFMPTQITRLRGRRMREARVPRTHGASGPWMRQGEFAPVFRRGVVLRATAA